MVDIPKEEPPLSVSASILNTLEVEEPTGRKTISVEETTDVVKETLEKHYRVASRKGGYNPNDVNDSSHVDGAHCRPNGKRTDNLNIYGIGRIPLLVTVLNSVKGPLPEELAECVKEHTLGVSVVTSNSGKGSGLTDYGPVTKNEHTKEVKDRLKVSCPIHQRGEIQGAV